MNFLLTSAGLTNTHIVQALIDLAGKPLSEITFVFVPTAANLDAGDKTWLIENLVDFQKQGFKAIDIVEIASLPKENWKGRLDAADVICFGGGNEQYLAQVFEQIGMNEYLVSLTNTNKVYMGISAGSMVSGQFISHELMQIVYPEESYPELAPPLGFVDFCFIPHLNSDWFQHVRKDTLENIKPRFTKPVYALDDETALKIKDGKVDVIGEGNWCLINNS